MNNIIPAYRRSGIILLPILIFSLISNYAVTASEYASYTRLISSDANGISLELMLGDLSVETKELDNSDYHVISYNDCAFTSETGKPKLPVSQIFVGVPPDASISVSVLDSAFSDSVGYMPLPVPDRVIRTSPDGIDYLADEFKIDRSFYNLNVFYPSRNAVIAYEGYIRRQRVAVVELRPVQYNPARKLIRKYSRLVVRVSFSQTALAPLRQSTGYSDKEFEKLYQSLLVNYESSRNWRKLASKPSLAPKSPKSELASETYKIFVEKAGIYKLDYATLQGAGIDLSDVDPRTIKIKIRGNEVPIYIHGENDGKFDSIDYIEFYGAKPDSIYTRWNVYWLSWGGARGMRMVQKNGSPDSPTARQVTFFESKLRFEEDHLHHKLQHTRPKVDTSEEWFESRDHWFWTGIENGSAKNEVKVNFPIYDPAQTLSRPGFKIELVGCTNFEHNIMVSLNGYRVGEEAKWSSQDIYLFDGQIPANSINEGLNELRLARIGTNPADGNDLDSYPYQIYLNWFEVDYVRKLMAVNDILEFSAPKPKEETKPFNIGLQLQNTLDSGKITADLRQRFKAFKVQLSDDARIFVQEAGSQWLIVDNRQTYLIIKEGSELNVYVSEINNYNIGGFLSDDIELFQISNSNAVCKLKNVVVSEYKLDREGKDRVKAIMKLGMNNNGEIPKVPDVAYSVNFEDEGGQPLQYIAVTSSSILRPERIERDTTSSLKDPSNSADYLIIAHPIFMEVAQRLADWRSSKPGGGFRSRVLDVTDIYDEFGFGMPSPRAIKDFLRYAYHNWSEPVPSYVLIFGDATYDFLGIKEEIYDKPPELSGFIPTFYIWSAFGQTAVDHWFSTVDGDDGFPDIYLGRIPVDDVSQAENVLEKIIANESGMVNGQWRKQIISIADDDTHATGDELFQIGLEDVWQNHTPIGYDTKKIYLKEIVKQVEQNPDETRIPAQIVEDMIIESFGKGAVIAQYSGHGGRHVWAHEIVFSITDIDSMMEAKIYPFLLVLSCYNGYFDLPGELSMAEGMLRAKRRGSVAMLSATRLTYGTGNVVLNNLLFDAIFKDKMLKIGQASTVSKIRLLLQEGLLWLAQMNEYTLFGDPASRLNIPDYEVHPQLANATVSANGKLEIKAGQLVTSTKDYSGTFTGNMTATVIFPDGRESSKDVSVTNGSYPSISFDVPVGTAGGMGQVKFYGENTSETVVGGVKFSVSEPFLIDFRHDISGSSLQIYAKISDDAGAENLKSVTFSWSLNRGQNWTESPMVFSKQDGAYKLSQTIKLTFQGESMLYYITAEDIEQKSIKTEKQTLQLPSKPNITIDVKSSNSEASVFYTYQQQTKRWGINVDLVNTGTVKISCMVRVVAFEGNPDRNGDRIVDNDAKILGQSVINPSDWKNTKEDEAYNSKYQVVRAFVPFSLSTGRHIVSVWVDPEFNEDHSENVFGDCDEGDEGDNLFSKVIDVTHAVFTPGQGVSARSLDNTLRIDAPAGSVAEDKLIVIESVQDMQNPLNQPDVSSILLPDENIRAYIAGNGDMPIIGNSPSVKFDNPVSIQMHFNYASFRDKIKAELGLGNIPESQMDAEQKRILEETLKNRESDLGIYLWYDSARKWARLPSQSDQSGISRRIHNTIPVSNNAGTGMLERSSITPDPVNTPAGEWVILFTGANNYQLYLRETGVDSRLEKLSDKIGITGNVYYDDSSTGSGTGIRFVVNGGSASFQFGDILKFNTIELSGQADSRLLLVDNVKRENTGDGIVSEISIDENKNTPVDEWLILFVDPEHFTLQGRKTGIVMRNGEPYIGAVGEEFYDQLTGIRFAITPGMIDFATGDKFKFRTIETGLLRATSGWAGRFSTMMSNDNRPPGIHLNVADQNFADGDVVSSEPTVHAIISDENGVDVLSRKLDITISMDGEEPRQASEDDYVFHWDIASNDVPVNYSPGKLKPGRYEAKFRVYDFNGNASMRAISFEVKKEFELGKGSLMNYPNPFERETDITFHLTSEADEAVVKIYTVSGRLIRTLEQVRPVNFVVIHWDGRDEDGREVANGVYYYRVRLKRDGRKDIVETGKMLKLK